MPKDKTIKESIAILRTENKHQTESINSLVVTMKDHIKSSNEFRQTVAKQGTDIGWLKKSSWGLYAIVSGIIIWVVSSFISG